MAERDAISPKLLIVDVADGRSKVVQEGPPPSNAFSAVPGFDPAVIWGTEPDPVAPAAGKLHRSDAPLMPQVGGTRLWRVVFPPDSVMMSPDFDPQAAALEYANRLPGFAEHFEINNPGMHTTPTVDYDIVLEGEITLELDDGAMHDLKAGDIVVQYGARHAWRNRIDKPATMMFVLIGAAGASDTCLRPPRTADGAVRGGLKLHEGSSKGVAP